MTRRIPVPAGKHPQAGGRALFEFEDKSLALFNVDGQLFAIFIMALTSAEVSLALAMVVYLHRRKRTVNTDMFSELKG